MKKTGLALALIVALLMSVVAGVLLANLASANPVVSRGTPQPEFTISVLSHGNKTYTATSVQLSFTVYLPPKWDLDFYAPDSIISTVYPNIVAVQYSLDGFQHQLAGGEISKLVSVNLWGLSEGTHTLEVTANATWYFKEFKGVPGRVYQNVFASSGLIKFTVDTLPGVSVLSPQNKTYDASAVPLGLTVNQPVNQTSYSLDGQANVTITGNTALNGLSNGEHNVTVYVQDYMGNIGASETILFSVKEPALEPFPATLVTTAIVSVAVVGIGLLVYFKKRKN